MPNHEGKGVTNKEMVLYGDMASFIKVKNKADKFQTLGRISCQNFEFSAIKNIECSGSVVECITRD